MEGCYPVDSARQCQVDRGTKGASFLKYKYDIFMLSCHSLGEKYEMRLTVEGVEIHHPQRLSALIATVRFVSHD